MFLMILDWYFSIAEVEAFEVQSWGDEVNEEEADHCSIEIDNISQRHIYNSNKEAHSNYSAEIDDFLYIDLSCWCLTKPKHPKYSFSASTYNYLLMSRNSGKTE